jgi:hypothetical protein
MEALRPNPLAGASGSHARANTGSPRPGPGDASLNVTKTRDIGVCNAKMQRTRIAAVVGPVQGTIFTRR